VRHHQNTRAFRGGNPDGGSPDINAVENSALQIHSFELCPLQIDIRELRAPQTWPGKYRALKVGQRLRRETVLRLDLNRASPWFNSSMRRGYARGVTRHKQAAKTRYD